jgi:Uma2 family endonuclease
MEQMLAGGQRLTVDQYLAAPETRQRYELVYGVVREPPAPSWSHQKIVGRVFERLKRHVTKLALGEVAFSPLDVILDAEKHLVVQPDIVFVSTARRHIIRDRLWGAPDLAVEVLSVGSRGYVRSVKRDWYGLYGVRELWIVDPVARKIEVAGLGEFSDSEEFENGQMLRSHVLPRLRMRVAPVFGG